MLSTPPKTGNATLDTFLQEIYQKSLELEEKTIPEEGWSLTDLRSDLSEVISDKRDLIDIVTKYDDLKGYSEAISAQKEYLDSILAETRRISEHSQWFAEIMEWWDQNYKIIQDSKSAMASATDAAGYAANAKTSETNAKASETAAATSETNAKTSETNADTKATQASTSATNAKTSETNAKASETAAEGYAGDAAASATKTGQDVVKTAANQEVLENAVTAAAGSATTAEGHATAADASKVSAATSATNADTSATNAATSANEAATSANEAATSANEAATHGEASRDAAAVAVAAAVSVAQFQGHGFPEGKVAAPVGAIYTDLDATAGAIRWIKASGTGNTGWKVEYGDTGLRDISTLVSEAWRGTYGRAYIRRYNGNQVDLILYNLSHAGAEGLNILDLPAGFGGVIPNVMPRILFHTSSAANFRSHFSTVRRLAALAPHPPAGSQSFGSVTYSTNDPWPGLIPGTPV